MKCTIKRIANDLKDGCFGTFLIEGLPFCVTMEETWLDNKNNISCIPEGVYEVAKYSGTKYKNVWLVKNVPNRSDILIHWGNTEENTAGCILMGMEYAYQAFTGGKSGIFGSMKAIEKLRRTLPDKFTLEIINHF